MINKTTSNEDYQLVRDGFTDKDVIPRMKMGDISTYNPWEFTAHPFVVVSMQDLVTGTGKAYTKHYDEITKAGGLHQFFGLDASNSKVKFILSSIIPDEMINSLEPENYVELITATNPDYFITNDGETYLDAIKEVIPLEIDRMLEYVRYIQGKTDVSLIGLIKGTSSENITYHAHCLQEMGINQFCFHTSDFLRKHNRNTIAIGKRLFQTARSCVPFLLAYGSCSRNSIRRFQSADGYITSSHFTQGKVAFNNGIQKRLLWTSSFDRELVMTNLCDICTTAKNLFCNQATLNHWMIDNKPNLYHQNVTMPNTDRFVPIRCGGAI